MYFTKDSIHFYFHVCLASGLLALGWAAQSPEALGGGVLLGLGSHLIFRTDQHYGARAPIAIGLGAVVLVATLAIVTALRSPDGVTPSPTEMKQLAALIDEVRNRKAGEAQHAYSTIDPDLRLGRYALFEISPGWGRRDGVSLSEAQTIVLVETETETQDYRVTQHSVVSKANTRTATGLRYSYMIWVADAATLQLIGWDRTARTPWPKDRAPKALDRGALKQWIEAHLGER